MTATRAALAVVVLAALGSCAPDGPRRLPAPELSDPAAPFRALATAGGTVFGTLGAMVVMPAIVMGRRRARPAEA